MSVQPLFAEPATQPQETAGPVAPAPTPDNCVFAWEEPPVAAPRGPSASASAQQREWFTTSVLPQLQQNPGKYAKVFSFDKRGSAGSRIKQLKEKHPGVDFVARASGTAEGKPIAPEWSVIYAAWVDGGTEPDAPPAAE